MVKVRPQLIRLIVVLCLTHAGSCTAGNERWSGPPQAQNGSRSSEYPHQAYATQRGGIGGDEYWIFTPENPRPAEAPVVVFVHGWGGMDPYHYGAWIRHLVRRGNFVIYPRYQANLKTRFDEMTPGALRGLQAAYRSLQVDGPVRPAEGKLAIVGYSMGGFIAANLAALAPVNGLPAPGALMIIAPGDGEGRMRRLGEGLKLVDMSTAPGSMIVLLVTGDADKVVRGRGAAKIWKSLDHSAVMSKEYITLAANKEFSSKLAADHLAPLAVDPSFNPDFSLYRPGVPEEGASDEPKGFFARRREARHQRIIDRNRRRTTRNHQPDAMDYDVYWRLFDDLLEVAFASPNKPDATKKWRTGFAEDRKLSPVRIIQRDREAPSESRN